MGVEEPINEWYHPTNGQPNNTAPAPKKSVTWVDETNPPADDFTQKEVDYELGMDIVYCNGTGKNVPAVYEGASTNGIKHTICL